MTCKFAQGLKQWPVKGCTCRVARLPTQTRQEFMSLCLCSLTRPWALLSHCRLNILGQQFKRSPSICISLETLLTSSCERPSVRTTRTLGMALRAPASAVKMDSFTCFMARPNARQQENTESIQIPAFHFVSAPVPSDTVLYRTPEVCDGVIYSPLSFVRKSYIRRTRGSLGLCEWHQLFSIYDSHSWAHSHIVYYIQVHSRDIKKWHLLLLLLRWIHSCQQFADTAPLITLCNILYLVRLNVHGVY